MALYNSNREDEALEWFKRAKEKGINAIVFDRSGYKYTGRVAALAEAAREAGLSF